MQHHPQLSLRKCLVVTLAVAGVSSILYLQARATTDEVTGELLYVPVYSSIFYENGNQTLELAATISIHNVNPGHSITVLRADYFTQGKLIKKYLDKPLVLGALQTSNLVVERANTDGGTGANFLVEWQAKPGNVVSPLVEGLMVNATSNLGIAFTTAAKVVRPSPAGK
jgi:hypothetical protein